MWPSLSMDERLKGHAECSGQRPAPPTRQPLLAHIIHKPSSNARVSILHTRAYMPACSSMIWACRSRSCCWAAWMASFELRFTARLLGSSSARSCLALFTQVLMNLPLGRCSDVLFHMALAWSDTSPASSLMVSAADSAMSDAEDTAERARSAACWAVARFASTQERRGSGSIQAAYGM